MAFINGRFVPDQMSGQQAPMQPQQATGNSMPMQAAMRNSGMQPTGPQFGMVPQNVGTSANMPMNNSISSAVSRMGTPAYASVPGQQQAVIPPPAGTAWNQQPQMPQQGWSGPAYHQFQPQMPQQSVEQSVQNGSPQSVSNFLTALNQVGAGSNNTFQNAQGQQGQGPQGGFQGFQQNGMTPQQNQFGGYSGPMNSQLGFAANNASQGHYGYAAAPQAYNPGVQQGGTGGMPGQPQFQQASAPQASAPNPYAGLQGQNFGSQQDAMVAAQQAASNAQAQARQTNSMTATSDVNSKQNITSGSGELQQFLDSLGVYSYEYKNKEYGEGRRIGPMAQEIESTPLGKAAISTNKEGYKQVDYGKLAGTTLASVALLNQKYNELLKMVAGNIIGKVSKRGK